jgi:hypothetical protein
MTIKSFINAQQKGIAGTPSKGWTFSWTSAQAASLARHSGDTRSRQSHQPAQRCGMYGTLIGGR